MDKSESNNSLFVDKKSRGRPRKTPIATMKLGNAGNIEMNENDGTPRGQKIPRSRGRPRSIKKAGTQNKLTDANPSTIHKGRGRPKKNNTMSNEDAAMIS